MKKLKVKDIYVGFAASTGRDAESWPCLLVGKHAEKKLRDYMTFVVEALIAKKEKGRIWEPKKKDTFLNSVCERFAAGEFHGEGMDGYATEDDKSYVCFRVWNKYPAKLVGCKLSKATNAMFLNTPDELWAYDTLEELPRLYLYNRKKTPLYRIIQEVRQLDNDSLEFFKIVDLESSAQSRVGPLRYADGLSEDGLTVFRTNWLSERD